MASIVNDKLSTFLNAMLILFFVDSSTHSPWNLVLVVCEHGGRRGSGVGLDWVTYIHSVRTMIRMSAYAGFEITTKECDRHQLRVATRLRVMDTCGGHSFAHDQHIGAVWAKWVGVGGTRHKDHFRVIACEKCVRVCVRWSWPLSLGYP